MASPFWALAEDPYVQAMAELARPVEVSGDLDALVEAAGERRVVLLGEASHGTSEFYTWRAEISRRLIEEMGFRFVAVEGDWADLYRLNQLLRDASHENNGDAIRNLLRSFDRWPRWLWANEETAEMAEWLARHNRQRQPEERAGFYGIDVYGWENAMDTLLEKIEETGVEWLGELEALYRDFNRYRHDTEGYARAAFAFASSAHEDVGEALNLIRENRTDLERTLGAEGYFVAEQHALVIVNAEAHIRGMAESQAESWNARARHFKKTVARLLEHHGEEARAVVWAHNTHVGDARATPMTVQGQINIGQLARQRWGDDVFILGFATRRGEIVAGRTWEAEPEVLPLPDAQPGSIDVALGTGDHSRALLMFDGIGEDSPLFGIRGHRAVGVVYQPEREAAQYVPTVLPRRYDALFFIDETTPLSPLH